MKLSFEDVTDPVALSEMTDPEVQVNVTVNENELQVESQDIIESYFEASEIAETVGQVDSIQDIVSKSIDNGGMSETAAQIAEIAVEALVARLGVQADRKLLPAMETFGSKHSRLTATKLSLESISETGKKIWESFVKVLKVIWEKIQAFYKAFNPKKMALKEYLQFVKKAAASVKGKQHDKSLEVTGHFIADLSIDGKCSFQTADDIIASSVYMLSGMSDLSSLNFDTATKSKNIFSAVTEKSNDQEVAAAKQNFGSVFRDYVTHAGQINGLKIIQTSPGMNVFASGYEFNLGDKDSIDFSFKHKETRAWPDSVEALTYPQMNALIYKIETLLKEFDKYDKCYKETEKLFEELHAFSSKGSEIGGIFFAAMRRIMDVSVAMNTKVPTVLMTGMKASCDYVHASAKAIARA